jgi:hypothetical protein
MVESNRLSKRKIIGIICRVVKTTELIIITNLVPIPTGRHIGSNSTPPGIVRLYHQNTI